MKKTQTIVDRERLSSDYIESKQDFSTVLSQVKQLPTTTSWKSPWFYGPIGIAVFTVTISIVSLNPTNAKVAVNEPNKIDIKEKESPTEVPVLEETKEQESVVETPVKIESEIEKPVKVAKKQKAIQEEPKKVEDLVAEISVKEAVSEKADPIKIQPVEKRKIPANNRYPHIEGVFTGEIQLSELFSENGIQLNPRVRITSYELNYFNGKSNVVQKIEGNTIPSDLHQVIEVYNLGQMIFITNIKAVDEMSRVFTLPSLNFKPVKNL